MIVTKKDARRIIAMRYPNFSFRITTKTQMGCSPRYKLELGMPDLAWKALARGADSAVRIGTVKYDASSAPWIDWSFGDELVAGIKQGAA